MNNVIILENKNLICFYKASGILSVRSRFHKEKKEENIFDLHAEKNLLPVHRLDREVSGLLLAAKNKSTQQILSSYFENKEIKKKYWALTVKCDLSLLSPLPFQLEEAPTESTQSFLWESQILRGKKRSYSSVHGKKTLTQAQYLGSVKKNTYEIHQWELSPLTGRSHQLRFEMARHQHPIVGDELYFAPLVPQYKEGIALVAKELDFSQCPEYEKLELPAVLNAPISLKDMLSNCLTPHATVLA